MTTKEFGILVPHVASARLVSPTTITLCKILHFVKGLVHGLGLDGNWFPANPGYRYELSDSGPFRGPVSFL